MVGNQNQHKKDRETVTLRLAKALEMRQTDSRQEAEGISEERNTATRCWEEP